MKITTQKHQPEFEPFDLTITIESEAERIAMYCLFNHAFVNLSLPEIHAHIIRDELESQGGPPRYHAKFDLLKEHLRSMYQ